MPMSGPISYDEYRADREAARSRQRRTESFLEWWDENDVKDLTSHTPERCREVRTGNQVTFPSITGFMWPT